MTTDRFIRSELTILCLLIFSSIIHYGMTSNQLVRWKTLPVHLDVKFTSKITFQDVANDAGSCGFKCSKANGCKSFTYNSLDGACTGHNDVYLNIMTDPISMELGRKYFMPNDGYSFYKATMNYYKVRIVGKTAAEASQYCRGIDAELTILDTMLKINSIWDLVLSTIYGYGSGATLFVSGYYNDDGIWKFWNNVSIPDAVWYSGGQPNGVKRCVYLAEDGLHDSSCNTQQMHVVCEKT